MSAEAIGKQATTSLITGILGLLCCAPLGIWAIIAGGNAEKMIAEQGVGEEHKSKATIGKVLGIVALVLWGLGILANIIMAIIAGGNAG